jgi:copper chaperone CopZ
MCWRLSILASMVLSLAAATSPAAEPETDSPAQRPVQSKATFSVRGMHCPPCANVLANSLHKTKGIHGAKVDWKNRQARVEIDEDVISIAAVARTMSTTPHMMGGNMEYSGSLVMKAPMLIDEASAKAVTDALAQIPGVAKVTPWLKQHAVTIRFSEKGDVTMRQLNEALAAAVPEGKQNP